MTSVIGRAVLFAADSAPRYHVYALQHRMGRLQTGSGIVIACYSYHLHISIVGRYIAQETVVQPHSLGRRIGGVENVSGYQQQVDLPLAYDTPQIAQEYLMLADAVVTEKGLSQMPVGRMDEFYHGTIGA